MKFTPKSDQELAAGTLIPEGVYPFEVSEAVSKTSKSGNEMIELNLRIYMPDGRVRMQRDWLLEKLAYKLSHFCKYTGLTARYEAGTLTDTDCQNKSGYIKIVIQEQKDQQTKYRNAVADYVKSPLSGSSKPQPTEAQLANQTERNDEVPF